MGLPGRPTNDPTDYFAWGKQSAKDTDATTFQFPKHLDGSGFDVADEYDRIREGGDGQEVGLSYRTLVKADPQLNALCRPNVAARLWAAVLGSDAVASAAVPSLAQHTAALVGSTPYFTTEQKSGDTVERVTNNVVTSLTLEAEAGKPWQLSAQFLSGGTVVLREAGSALTPSRDTGKPYFYPNGSYLIDGFASYGQLLTKVKVEVTRGVDDGIQTTGLSREDVIPLNFDATCDATIKVTSRDFYRKVKYTPTGSTIPVELATGSIDLTQLQLAPVTSTAQATSTMRVRLPLIEWVSAQMNKLDPDGKTVYLDVVGMSIKGATTPVIAQHDTNDVAAY